MFTTELATMPSDKTIGRLALYRRLLGQLKLQRVGHVFSHQLAALAAVSAAQARRDVMAVGYSGSPQHGYEVETLAEAIGAVLDATASGTEPVVLVGLGNLGRAIVSFFCQHHPRLAIVATFDVDPQIVGRVVQGIHCYPMNRLHEIVGQQGARVAILAVPAAAAQDVAYNLIAAGIRGLLNFAPVRLKLPGAIYCENFDMTLSLEKVAFFARQKC
jgi:redox-sensing transcriptional repressor